MQVPKLRFKEFNDEWKTIKIGDTLQYEQPNQYIVKSTKYDNKFPIPVLTANKTFILGYTNENFGIYDKGECVIFDDFTMDFKFVNFPYKVKSSAIKILTAKNNNVRFIYQLLKTITLEPISHQRHYISVVQNINIKIPSLEEQTKIADFLTLIDKKIELQQKLVDNLNFYKKGLLQKVFSNNSGWNYVKLYSVCDVRDGTHNSPKYIENGYPLVTSKNLSKNGQLDFSDISYISKQDYDEINKRSMVNVGDILFGMIGTIGNPVLLNKDGFAIKNIALIKEKTKLKNKFLIQFLNSSFIERQFDFNKTGGTQKFIGLNSIRQLLVPIPSIEEQNRIAELFSSIDDKISYETNLLNKLNEYKKGLLQQMFI